MPNNDRRPREPRAVADAPHRERNSNRASPDARRLDDATERRPLPNAQVRGGNIPRADYGDYGTDDVRSMGGVPPRYAPVPDDYPFSGIASEHRRGRFYGRGPKGYRRSDERIREEISDRLMTHPDIDASDIDVQVTGGIVTLNGSAEDRHEKRLAEFIADDVVGVDDVENRLKVRHGFWAALTHERAPERELPTRTEREPTMASREAGRANAARTAARRDAEAR